MFAGIQALLSRFYLYVIAGSAALNILLGGGMYVQGLRMHSAKVELSREKLLHKNDIENYKKAEKEATQKYQAALDKQNEEFNAIKKQEDEDYADLRRRFDASLLRYRDLERTSKDYSGAATSATPSGSQGSRQDPLVPVPMTDLSICAENTAKALIAHDWIEKLEQKSQNQPSN